MDTLRRDVVETAQRDEGALLDTLPWFFVALGTVLRLQQFLHRRSLWLDEATLSRNITLRSFGRLLEPLTGNQAAPPMFLFLERGSVLAFGNNEYALRLVPLIAGIAVLFVATDLARRYCSELGAALALALISTAPWLVYFSAEVKQYSLDVLATLVVLDATLRLLDGPITRARTVRWSVLCSGAFWFSHASVLAFAGIASIAGLRVFTRRRISEIRPLMVGAMITVASLVGLYAVQLRFLRNNARLDVFWQRRDAFPPRHLLSVEGWSWLAGTGRSLLANPGGFRLLGVAAVCAGLGALTLVRSKPWRAAALLAAAPVCVVAARLHVYPMRERLMLFSLPLLLVGMASAVDLSRAYLPRVSERVHRASSLAVAAAVLAASAAPIATSARAVVRPDERNEIRPVLQYVAANLRPGDALWIHEGASIPFYYYGGIVQLHPKGLLLHGPAGPACDAAVREFGSTPRAWIVFSHYASTAPANEFDIVLSHLDTVGRRVLRFAETGSFAVLYDNTSGGSDPLRTHILGPSSFCLKASSIAERSLRTGLHTGPFGTGARS